MAVLKKVKGTTILETLVATILIVIVFILSSMILNELFSATVKNNTQDVEGRINNLRYLQLHEKITIPYQESYKKWNITVVKTDSQEGFLIAFEAINSNSKKSISKTYHANH